MPNFLNDFRSPFDTPPGTLPTLGTRPPMSIPQQLPPGNIVREIPIGRRPPFPTPGPTLTPAQRLAMIFRRAAGNPDLIRRLQMNQRPMVQRGLARRRGL